MTDDIYRRCPACGTAMTLTVVEGRNPTTQYECPDQRCQHIEPFYGRREEGEA